MLLKEAISQRIFNLSIQSNLSYYQISKMTGIPRSTISDMVTCKTKSPGIQNIERISEAFGINIREFFNDEIFDYVVE